MRCVYCGYAESKVLESRATGHHDQIRRRRECISCGKRFTTYERAYETISYVLKKDGRQEPYYHQKALKSIHMACRKRPVTLKQMEELLKLVEKQIIESVDEVTTKELGQIIMEELKNLDPIAYIRFASVYLDFDHPHEFSNILKQVPENPTPLSSRQSHAGQNNSGNRTYYPSGNNQRNS